MEKQSQISTKPNARIRTDKLSLDDYLSFINSHNQIDLTINLLNQIIVMHGFNKLRFQKKVLIDAVNSIELTDPSRSTLKDDDNVSSHAFITLEEVIKDLADLNWQECCATSIQTLNSVNYDSVLQNDDASLSKSKPKKRATKRLKFSRLRDVAGDGIATAAVNLCGSSGGSQSVCSSAVAVGRDGDFGATVGGLSESSSTFRPISHTDS